MVDGCPPRLPLSEADIQPDLDRRRPGQSAIVTQRKEIGHRPDPEWRLRGQTLGTPISLEIPNEDMRPGDYREMEEKYRPSHADYTYDAKYGDPGLAGRRADQRAGDRGRVAGGAIARKLLPERYARADRRLGVEGGAPDRRRVRRRDASRARRSTGRRSAAPIRPWPSG